MGTGQDSPVLIMYLAIADHEAESGRFEHQPLDGAILELDKYSNFTTL